MITFQGEGAIIQYVPVGQRHRICVHHMERSVRDVGRKEKYTSSIHPQTDWVVERYNNTSLQMLSYLIADDHRTWKDMLKHATRNNNMSRGTGIGA